MPYVYSETTSEKKDNSLLQNLILDQLFHNLLYYLKQQYFQD